MNQQYISIDGKETPYVEGIFHVYGHGNVLGIGQALEQDPGHLKVTVEKRTRDGSSLSLLLDKVYVRKYSQFQRLLVQVLLIY